MREDLHTMVLARDFEAIEGARSTLRDQDVLDLVALYPTLQTWSQRLGLVDLLQDQWVPSMQPILLDVLRAPGEGDPVDLTKAAALGLLDEDYDTFMRFYNDRAALKQVVDRVLADHGLEIDGAPDDAPEEAWPRLGGDDEEPLMSAVMNSEIEAALVRIEAGDDVNQRRKVGAQSVLGWAAFNGLTEVVRALLARGAEVDIEDEGGGTPLQKATANGHFESAQALLQAGADPHRPHRGSRNLLMGAIRGGNVDVVELLLNHGADPHQPQPNYTPLAYAIYEGTPATVELLLARGADPNRPGTHLPLVLAARAGRPRQVQRLLDAGADPRLTDAQGRTAHEVARGRRAKDVRDVLEAALRKAP